ncbi:MAG: ATP-dependent RecD-like DNA helicase [Verrucomicrobiota bacterium]|nr:ATP-dependent RecD-like DNA helicase [Verrucomicrobiota bacterium]
MSDASPPSDVFTRAVRNPAPGDRKEDISGVVESVVFRNEESGYTVCSIRLPEKQDPVTVVGNCATIWLGENLRATGAWARHRRHGYQFQADSITCIAPTSARGIERYLASGLIRGIGKVMAERLARAFGDKTLYVIEHESARLEEIVGIGPVRRKMIKESWAENRAVRDIMIFLQSHGVGAAQSTRIFKQYGNNAVALVTENPYRLCRDIWGIGFKTADKVAMSIGVPPQSEVRARAGLVYTLHSLAEDGHCYALEPELLLQAQALLDIPVEALAGALQKEVAAGRLVKDGGRIYLRALHDAEVHVAEKLKTILGAAQSCKPILVDKAVPWAEQRMKIRFASAQAEALRMALAEKVSIITGGPGVGKTTIIRALVDVFGRRKLKVRLAAPTGRAAKRMEEATRHEAQTIHRLLKFQPRAGGFEHGPDNPIEGDVVVLDEVSMLDLSLMSVFLGALPNHASLVLVGDVDQLPSVGPGNVLRDLIDSGVIPCRQLDTIYRQEAGSAIVRNAHRINRGEALELPDPKAVSDFYFIESQDSGQVLRATVELVTDRIPRRFRFDPMRDIQVLTPMRRNQLGAENLNAALQQALNPAGVSIQRFGRAHRVGDRVMQIRNNYDKAVFNGDIGHIASLSEEEQQIVVDFDGRKVPYNFDELDELMHAYACTIHKAQGCEYPAVVVLMATQHFKLLQRNLLYTAITRGKKLVCLVGSRKAVWLAIRNNRILLRRTGLRQRLSGRDELPDRP